MSDSHSRGQAVDEGGGGERAEMTKQKKVRSKKEMALAVAASAALSALGAMPADFDEYHELSKALEPYKHALELHNTGVCPDCGSSGYSSDGRGSGEFCGCEG